MEPPATEYRGRPPRGRAGREVHEVGLFVAHGAAVRWPASARQIRSGIVTGPSLTRLTCMSAPNSPLATGMIAARAVAITRS